MPHYVQYLYVKGCRTRTFVQTPNVITVADILSATRIKTIGKLEGKEWKKEQKSIKDREYRIIEEMIYFNEGEGQREKKLKTKFPFTLLALVNSMKTSDGIKPSQR
uniref:Uncharacterized protein n=1 Tax=Glossina pallidipes TaxID=7398 RepID=A0A1B0AF44_GLOPL